MKLSINKTIISILLIATSSQVQSFIVSYNPSISTNHRSSSSKSTQLNALTAQDILKRARKAAGVEEEPEPEPIFNDQIMNDFQQSLLMLEKRVKAGPGSLSSDEVKDLEIMLNRIMKDMVNHDGVVSRSVATTTTNTPAPAPVATAAPTQSNHVSSTTFNEHNDEEGEAYAGKGGLGLAKGTANTYIIDGMDEMSPEEYRAALQESISGRQSKRRSSGIVGNMSSNNYLNNI